VIDAAVSINEEVWMNTSMQVLQTIPGVGKSIARDLLDLGVRHVRNLKGRDPERLYQKRSVLRNMHIDRCVLYTFRSAVYFASEKKHDPALLKWWNWKDDKMRKTGRPSTAAEALQRRTAPRQGPVPR
jgi:hypothetical protein